MTSPNTTCTRRTRLSENPLVNAHVRSVGARCVLKERQSVSGVGYD